jgi:competence protein ComEC
VAALVLGETTEVTPAQWEVLTRTGVNHLVSISGLHVGLVAASLFFLTRWFWSRSPWLVSRLAAPRAGALGGLVAALIYSALAGFAVCTQRSLIMLGVVLVALLWSRTPRPWTGLTFALAAVLLLEPTEALSFGLWLSFGGVAALIYGLGNRLALEGLWRRWGQAQWVATLGFLPLMLLLFSRASVVSPLVNLVAIPLFGLLLPLVLIAAALAIDHRDRHTPRLDRRPAGLAVGWPDGDLGLALGLGGYLGAAGLGLGGGLRRGPAATGAPGIPGRWLGLPLLLPLGLLTPPAPATGEAWLRLLDVGQGLSAVIRTAHHVLVFDTGPAFLGGFNTGEAVVVPYLRDQGVSRIDTLVLSHGDQDHVGGFAGLAAQMPIDRILAGEPGDLADPRAEPCLAGQGWTWDGVDFAVLYPAQAGLEGNESSCVLRVATQGASLLVPGDLGQAPERQLARGGGLATTLLVAGHHGSNTSSSREFLAAVAPAWVLYASGFANRYGFPSAPGARAGGRRRRPGTEHGGGRGHRFRPDRHGAGRSRAVSRGPSAPLVLATPGREVAGFGARLGVSCRPVQGVPER